MNKTEIIKDIKDSIKNPSSKYQTFTVSCSGEVIGMYTISKNVNLEYYISHFFVQDQIILDEHPRGKHGKIMYKNLNNLKKDKRSKKS